MISKQQSAQNNLRKPKDLTPHANLTYKQWIYKYIKKTDTM